MTARPGVNVQLLETSTPVSIATDTGQWFAAGTTERGPSNMAMLIQSLDQFTTIYGPRQSYSVLYDAVETFFREGGARVYIGRVVGPAATTGTKSLLDAGAGVSLIANANGAGAWSSNYKVAVVAGNTAGSYRIQVTDSGNVVLEESGDLVNQGSAVAWSLYSTYIRIALGATTLNPAPVAAGAMSAGNDQRASITDAEWATALALFSGQYGPGQVSQPGRTTSVAYSQIKAHVETYNRVGVLDLPDSATTATVKAAAATVTSRFCAAYAPWIVVPGITTGTVRSVPPCALIAGLCARNDRAIGTNTPSAGNNGVARSVIDLTQPDWNDVDRTDLNSNSCNVIRRMFGGVRVYGWRALVNAQNDPSWVNFANSRFYTELNSELNNAGENYVFAQIDGQNGGTINAFNSTLSGILLQHYLDGELFGDEANEAFRVDTGPGVNTLQTLANNELRAVCSVKMSPFAEYVLIQIVKRQVTQTL